MKKRLLELIDKTDEIEKLFRWSGSNDPDVFIIPSEIIYDVQEFRIWIQELKYELQDIYDRTHKKFIWDTINDVSAKFDGWNDRGKFDKIKGDLIAIRNNIDSYYPQEKKNNINIGKMEKQMKKKPKIFISHSSKDTKYVELLVALFDDMGLDEDNLFCSSVPGYGIPVSGKIFDYLREQFQEFDLHVIFVHSKSYYDSPISLNEMGAAWVLKNNFTSFLLPGFGFNEMKGVVNSDSISIKLDNSVEEIKDKLNQLYDQIIEEFGLKRKKGIIWEKKRDAFIKSVNELQSLHTVPNTTKNIECTLSIEADEILYYAAHDKHAQILITHTLGSGKCIQVGVKSYSESLGVREFSKWDAGFEELLSKGFIKANGTKNEVFQVTKSGFEYIDGKFNLE